MDDMWTLIEECRKIGLLDKDGALDWKKLIAKDDINLFKKYQNVPVSGYETFKLHLEHTNLKQQIAYFIRFEMYDSAFKIMADQNIDDASQRLIDEIDQKIREITRMNDRRYSRGTYQKQNDNSMKPGSPIWEIYELYNRGIANESNKRVLFKDIINNNDPGFFELACESDPQNITWALNNVSKTNFDAIDILLKHGGKVITTIPYNDDDAAWLGKSSHDEIDEVATEILRLEIEKLKGLRK